MIYGKSDEVIEELFESFLSRYQIDLEKLIKYSSFIFDDVELLCYKCHKTNPHCSGSNKDFPDSTKNKATLNPINKNDDNFFKYAVTLALNYETIDKKSGKRKNIEN